MKQIISFKKDLPFKTKVSDITSISLERNIKVEEDGIVSGVFYITGDYKMNEGSINRDEFSFDLPFDITLDPRYDISTVKADIDDFCYDLDNDTLKVNIDLYVEAEYLDDSKELEEGYKEIILDNKERDEGENKIEEENKEERNMGNIKDNVEELEDDDLFKEIPIQNFKVGDVNDEKIGTDLFSNLDETETYVTYYAYIVKEDDNIDKIMNKYGVTREELEDYNDLNNIKTGDKLIIPKCDEK